MLGPADYTPGGFRNEHSDSFLSLNAFSDPGETCRVVGTRARELALCVVFDSPLRCLCDLPSVYAGAAGVDALFELPCVWDQTVALDGCVGDYYVVARRAGARWFVCGITDENARLVCVSLGFLPDGIEFDAVLYTDSPETERDARAVSVTRRTVRSCDSLEISLARDGGFFVVLTPTAP